MRTGTEASHVFGSLKQLSHFATGRFKVAISTHSLAMLDPAVNVPLSTSLAGKKI